MGKVQGYKCEICGVITEEVQYALRSYGKTFSVEKTSYIESFRDTACSLQCLHQALNNWMDSLKKIEKEEKLIEEGAVSASIPCAITPEEKREVLNVVLTGQMESA
jgi:hypothetical protein